MTPQARIGEARLKVLGIVSTDANPLYLENFSIEGSMGKGRVPEVPLFISSDIRLIIKDAAKKIKKYLKHIEQSFKNQGITPRK